MTLNFVQKQATKQLASAMQMRSVRDMEQAFDVGANLDFLEVRFPGIDEVFRDPIEIALTCALPLEGFKLLAQHGARMQNMEEGMDGVRELFESLPSDMEDHWPDMKAVFNYLQNDPLINSDPVEKEASPVSQIIGHTTSSVKDVSSASIAAVKNASASTTGAIKGKVGGFFGKFKKE